MRRLPGIGRLAGNPLARDASAYVIALVLSRLPAFLFLPVYAAFLEPSELGRLVTAMLLVDLVQTLAGAGMVQALGRYIPVAATPEERKRMVGTALATAIAGCAAVTAAVAVAWSIEPLRESLEILGALEMQPLLLALFAGTLVNLGSLGMAYLRSEQRAFTFLAALSLGAALETALCIAMVSARKVDLEAILAIECARGLVTAAFLALAARRDLSLRFSPATFRTFFRFGIWLVPVGFFVWISLSIDRFWLGQMAGMDQLGVYGFFCKFATPAAILFQGYIISMDSHLFKMDPAAGIVFVRKSLSRYLVLGGLMAAAASVAFPLAIHLAIRQYHALPETYLSGLKVYPLLLATTYVYYWAIHYAALLEFQYRPRRQLAFMGLAAAANFALCPALIALGARLGIDSLSAATLSNLLSACLLLFLQSRGSSLRSQGAPLWWRAVPVVGLLAGMHLVLVRLG